MHGQVSFIYVNPCMISLNCVVISCTRSHFILSLPVLNPWLLCIPLTSYVLCLLSFCLFILSFLCLSHMWNILPTSFPIFISLPHTYSVFLCLLPLSKYILLSLGYRHLYLVHNFCLHLCHLMEYYHSFRLETN